MSGPPPLSVWAVWAVWAGHFCLHLPFSLLVSLCEDGMNLLKLNFFKIPIVLYSAVLFFFFWPNSAVLILYYKIRSTVNIPFM